MDYKKLTNELYQKMGNLQKEICRTITDMLKEHGEVEFDYEEDDVRLVIKNDYAGDCSGLPHTIVKVEEYDDDDFLVTDDEENEFTKEDFDIEALAYIADRISEKI